MVPEYGVSIPAIPDSSVDLPDAFGPMSAVTAPSGTVNDEGAIATVDPNRYSTSVASIAFIRTSIPAAVFRPPLSTEGEGAPQSGTLEMSGACWTWEPTVGATERFTG